ncbi:anti-sigma factor domain-containing protein [Cohnella abietis]|uniref:RsgI N-terminal anti-sigma domain-containing protein n=1 Tax=Cohnella abietis TaxID=2507935 RepID=A0A3T1D278_9BACL|nr:anti-sigma factor domain-containing protein [Cohnella abietis]BBI32158.1 hypothetical protein KCTCHS21_15570 [Cohnella abietis]
MKRGTIMAIEKKTVVLLTAEGQFIRVKKQAHFEIGEEITDYESVRAIPRIRQRMLQTGVFGAALLLIIICFLMLRTPPVVAYVTMDVNPSIELGLDAREKVRQLRALNEDADAIVTGVKYRGRDLETVMNELAHKLVDKHMLTSDDGEIVIASVPIKPVAEQWEKQVTQTMTRVLDEVTKQEDLEGASKLEVTTVSLPVEVRNEAEANGVSSGKMAFWLISESQGHELSLETLKKDSLKKIAASWGGVNKVMSPHEKKKEKKQDDKKDNIDKNKIDKKDNKENKNDKDKRNNRDKIKRDEKDQIKGDKKDEIDKSNKNKNDKREKDKKEKRDKRNKNNIDKQEKWKKLLDEAKQKNKSEKSSPSENRHHSGKEHKPYKENKEGKKHKRDKEKQNDDRSNRRE